MELIKAWSRNEWLYYSYAKLKSSLQKYIDDTFESSQIIENLWIGSISSSCNRDMLHKYKIETIISAFLGSTASFPFDFHYERAKLRDVEDENIIDDIKRLLPIIHNELMNGRGVLCHCMQGKSRSVSIVAAYLIKYRNMTTNEAIEFIKSKRTQIDPNPGYMIQLIQFEKEIKEKKIKND